MKVKTMRQRTLGLGRKRAVLVPSPIGQVIDIRIVRKPPGLLDVKPRIRHRSIDVVTPLPLTARSPDVGQPKPRAPVAVLDGEVVLQAVGNLQMWIQGRRQADSCDPLFRTAGGKHPREDDCGVSHRISISRLVQHVGQTAKIDVAGTHVVIDPKAAAENGVVSPGAISRADAGSKIVFVIADDGLARQPEFAGFDDVHIIQGKERTDLGERPVGNHDLA